jgi:hypothetical protein
MARKLEDFALYWKKYHGGDLSPLYGEYWHEAVKRFLGDVDNATLIALARWTYGSGAQSETEFHLARHGIFELLASRDAATAHALLRAAAVDRGGLPRQVHRIFIDEVRESLHFAYLGESSQDPVGAYRRFAADRLDPEVAGLLKIDISLYPLFRSFTEQDKEAAVQELLVSSGGAEKDTRIMLEACVIGTQRRPFIWRNGAIDEYFAALRSHGREPAIDDYRILSIGFGGGEFGFESLDWFAAMASVEDLPESPVKIVIPGMEEESDGERLKRDLLEWMQGSEHFCDMAQEYFLFQLLHYSNEERERIAVRTISSTIGDDFGESDLGLLPRLPQVKSETVRGELVLQSIRAVGLRAGNENDPVVNAVRKMAEEIELPAEYREKVRVELQALSEKARAEPGER